MGNRERPGRLFDWIVRLWGRVRALIKKGGDMADKDIQGNASVSRNAAIGGSAHVGGDLTVGHDLLVNGWLEARNIKGAMKGLFKTVAELEASYPYPSAGWYALVGESLPAPLYVCVSEDGRMFWKATGKTGGVITAEVMAYTERLGAVESRATKADKTASQALQLAGENKLRCEAFDGSIKTLQGEVTDLQTELSKTDSIARAANTTARDNKQSIESAINRIDTADSKLAKLAAEIGGSVRIVDFSGVESPAIAPAVKAQTAAEPFSIVFLTTADKFVAKKGSEYYGGWGDAGMSDFYDDSGHIRKDCIFRDGSGALWYSPGAGQLVKFSTSEDLAKVKKSADSAIAKLTADIAGSLRIVDFTGWASPTFNPTVKAQSAAEPYVVVYIPAQDRFTALKDNEYYAGWATRSDFYDDSGDIRKDCIFRMRSGGLYYRPGAGEFLKISTSTDLATVRNIAEGAASKATQAATAVTTLSGRVDKAESDLDLLSDQVSENRSDISKVEKGHEILSEKVAEDWEYISDMLSDIEDLQTGQGATANDVAGVKGRLDNLEAKPAFVPFWGFLETAEISDEEAPEPGMIAYVRDQKKFVTRVTVDGETKHYWRFEGYHAYYDSITGNIRKDCIFYCKFALNIPKFYFAKTSDHLVYIPDEKDHKDLLERIKSLQEEDSEIKGRMDAVETGKQDVVRFDMIYEPTTSIQVKQTTTGEITKIYYIPSVKKFVGLGEDSQFYLDWPGRPAFYTETGSVRRDCFFTDGTDYYVWYRAGLRTIANSYDFEKTTDKITALTGRVAALEAVEIPEVDLSPVEGRLDALEGVQRPMLPIFDIVETAEIIQGYPDEEAAYSEVVYVREAHKFVLKIGGSYYSNWKGQEQYMRKMGLPRCNCLFYINSYKGFDRQWYFYYDDLYYVADSRLIEALEARLSNLEKVEKRVATLEAKKPAILPFRSILETAEIEEGGPDVKPWGGHVRYVSDQRKFVVQASSGGPYVGNWKGREDYHYSDGGVREDCIFLLENYAKPKFYRFYSLKGLLIPLSDQLDIDTINKKIEKLENSEAPEVDLSPLETRLDSLEAEADGTVRIPCFDKMANDIEDYLEAGVKYYLKDVKAFLTPRGTGNADTEWRLQNLVVPEKSGWYIDRETGNLVFMHRRVENGSPGIYHDHIWLESYHYEFEENIGAAFQYLVDEVVSPLEARVSALEAQEAEMQGEINELSMGVQELYCQLTGNYPTPLETPEAPMVMSLGESEAGEQTAVQTPEAGSKREEAMRRIREILKSRIRIGETEAEPPAQEQTASRMSESSSEAEPPSQEQTGESSLGG